MSAIFISHSSKDKNWAERVKAWLEENGHRSLFLDFDPETGLAVGDEWEQKLYAKLRQCQAVLLLVSEHWLASKWCFAEAVQAFEAAVTLEPENARYLEYVDGARRRAAQEGESVQPISP